MVTTQKKELTIQTLVRKIVVLSYNHYLLLTTFVTIPSTFQILSRSLRDLNKDLSRHFSTKILLASHKFHSR